jgi:ribosomal RNA-processing protein 1
MSDRPRTQQQLARDLAGLVDILPNDSVLPFLEAFWRTMAREWMGIDVLRYESTLDGAKLSRLSECKTNMLGRRMDKFLYLVRVYSQASFRHFSRGGWSDEDGLRDYMKILEEIPFNPRDTKIPDGLRYHCIDIYVDELDRVDEQREEKLPIEILLQPLRNLGKQTLSKIVRSKVKEALEDERLKDWLGQDFDETKAKDNRLLGGEAEDDEWNGIED